MAVPSTSARSASASPVHGGMRFAAVLLLVVGVLGVLQGIAAVAGDSIYASVGKYAFKFNLTAWGWIHMVLGVLSVLAGWGVLRDTTWGRTLGIWLASLSMIASFLFLIYLPAWSLAIIAIDVFIVWALVSYAGSPESMA
ncbi:hypothetical protein DN069_01815 [Streptacidiphilus pinicola]|uniref:DUF7144 domain-containing protein n=1 Tax=Streptacidiphilus pinicola TaxID=2219663 RepID=A0A2X0IUJ1_9ACTN|nr:hypothetical protein [Streptacidiphilus pinicola]RAG87293.1 hypothetical protein DN069_01815 [Streptacidiphilus pinicola]